MKFKKRKQEKRVMLGEQLDLFSFEVAYLPKDPESIVQPKPNLPATLVVETPTPIALDLIVEPILEMVEPLMDTIEVPLEPVIKPTLELVNKPPVKATVEPIKPTLELVQHIPTPSHATNFKGRTDLSLYGITDRDKYQANVAAIKLLKQLKAEHRMATEEEQLQLARYVGWGGLSRYVESKQTHQELASLITEFELEKLKESVLSAYYTDPRVIEQIFNTLSRFGFKGGTILDPSMGTGNFFSMLPDEWENSALYGVELDTLTGEIAKQLFPKADIEIKGFEQTRYPDQFFDLIVGNVPFGDFSVNDPAYNKYHFKIHDYFIAKALNEARPGGLIAFITSKGTMDKWNSSVRRYFAERAHLIGAVRLPNHAFQAIAGTSVTTDILFFQKREERILNVSMETWTEAQGFEAGLPINRYFNEHPHMVLGEMVVKTGPFGLETTCEPFEEGDLIERLEEALATLEATYVTLDIEDVGDDEEVTPCEVIPASPHTPNFSYALHDGKVYFREYSKMYAQDLNGMQLKRVRGMIPIHDSLRRLIEFQSNPYYVETLHADLFDRQLNDKMAELNQLYDCFVDQYGFINAQGNRLAFAKDHAYPLLASLETPQKKDKKVFDKAQIFFKPTILKAPQPKKAKNAKEALTISLNIMGEVDLIYMSNLCSAYRNEVVTPVELITELGDEIYQDPELIVEEDMITGWVLKEEYGSGSVKLKLSQAKFSAQQDPQRYQRNVTFLETQQPQPISAEEINFILGSVWIPIEYYREFMHELFQFDRSNIQLAVLNYSDVLNCYNITHKSMFDYNILCSQTYGTGRLNAVEIFEYSLNLKTVVVNDYVEKEDSNGKTRKVPVLNQEETMLAREKQIQIKLQFESWLFSNASRTRDLVNLYNDLFNDVKPRTYNGEHLTFPGMSDAIELRKHQRDVIAHGIYGGGNLLIAHEVGAGKTYSAIAIAQEMKRIGLIQKPLFVVPNHLVEQWATEFLTLYPGANVLIARKKDLEKAKRRQFAGRIATGEYDAIIMAHSSFKKLPMSFEFRVKAMEDEIQKIVSFIEAVKASNGERWSIKRMQGLKKKLTLKLEKLYSEEGKDDTISFEELGVDALIVDEAHAYKNNHSYTKLQNVAGVGGRNSQQAADMSYKIQYINEHNDGRGVIFLTGTPISNSMCEMHVLQKNLQRTELEKRGLIPFDHWASLFGQITQSLEIKPEGNGYQMKDRFSRFHNLPELMSLFKIIADIKTGDVLDLPTPTLKTGGYQVIETSISEEQQAFVIEHGLRAEAIRTRQVSNEEDNFLKLTQDAKMNAVDPRVLDHTIPRNPDTKLCVCAAKVAEIYFETADKHLTQLIFCDKGTPDPKKPFNFYDAVKEELLLLGVKKEEIAYIHDFNTDEQKKELFSQLNEGVIRILLGSTEKMGTGMNAQRKMIALHHLDVPWRPSDLVQRNGRILRQGNENEEVSIFNYITQSTFDSYLWQIIEQKQRYISQIMTSKTPARSCEDVDEIILQYAEFKALAVSDDRIKIKMELDNELSRLTLLKNSWVKQRHTLNEKLTSKLPNSLATFEDRLQRIELDWEHLKTVNLEPFQLIVEGTTYEGDEQIVMALELALSKLTGRFEDEQLVGTCAGFKLYIGRDFNGRKFTLRLNHSYFTSVGPNKSKFIEKIKSLIAYVPYAKKKVEDQIETVHRDIQNAQLELDKPFLHEDRLKEVKEEKAKIDLALEFNRES